MIPQSDGINVQKPQSATTPRRLTYFIFFHFFCSSNLYDDIAWRTYSFITLNTGTGCFPSNTLINIWIALTCVKSFFDVIVMIFLVSMTSMLKFCEQGVMYSKDKSPVDQFHGITSQYSYFEEIWIFAPIQQGTEKTWSCFALDTAHQRWAVTVQYLCRIKKISMTISVLPLHFSPSQASSSRNSKFDSHLQYCEVDSLNHS